MYVRVVVVRLGISRVTDWALLLRIFVESSVVHYIAFAFAFESIGGLKVRSKKFLTNLTRYGFTNARKAPKSSQKGTWTRDAFEMQGRSLVSLRACRGRRGMHSLKHRVQVGRLKRYYPETSSIHPCASILVGELAISQLVSTFTILGTRHAGHVPSLFPPPTSHVLFLCLGDCLTRWLASA
jgi:hypothetical protein